MVTCANRYRDGDVCERSLVGRTLRVAFVSVAVGGSGVFKGNESYSAPALDSLVACGSAAFLAVRPCLTGPSPL